MKDRILEGEEIPNNLDFTIGQSYHRKSLHGIYGGGLYKGISTPADYPVVFLFTGEGGEEYGYEDRFLPNDHFLYTGEGTEGDMEWNHANTAIRDHQASGTRLMLFENGDRAWEVTYLGEYEYVDHRVDTLPDANGNRRDAFRFELAPLGGAQVDIERANSLSLNELYDKAKASAPTSNAETTSQSGRTYRRSAVVKKFARREAAGVCQGCGEDAPFEDENGEPYLEVHHLYRRSDGGADDPDNVIALCPNCHRRVHHGRDGDEFNRGLIEQVERRSI